MALFKKFSAGASVAVLAALTSTAAVHAQQTDATLRGSVVDANGNPIAGASITILDTRTNAVSTTTTNEDGNFARTNLRVGGPYIATVSAPGYEAQQVNIGSLAIGSNPDLNLSLNDAREVIIVSGTRMGNQLEVRNGVGTAFSAEDIDDIPLLDRDLTNIIELDPLVSVTGDEGESGVVSFGGIEPRLNGFTVDGAIIADRFKLEEAFYPTLRQPISLDVIEAVAATYAEYSVLTSGAQGGLVNTVTRSGTNEIDGTIFFRYGNENFSGDESEFGPLPSADFTEEEFGITVAGPIIEDRLFFVLNYEEFEQASPDLYDLSQAELDTFSDIRNIFLNDPRYGGFDPGEKTNVIDDTRVSERFFGKLDWQINDSHRASFWYTNIQEQRLQGRGGYEYDFPTQAYDKTTDIDLYHTQIVSDWTDNLSTTFRFIYKGSETGQIPRVSLTNGVTDFGTFTIRDVFGRDDVNAGSDPFRHGNAFSDEQWQLFGAADYVAGNHIFTFGFEHQKYELWNLFAQSCRGEFEFDDITALQNGNADVFYLNLPGNDCLDRVAAWGYRKLDLFAQDEWQIASNFSVNFGARYERYYSEDNVPIQGDFGQVYGANTSGNLDGLEIFQPRFGFNWSAPYDIDVQGGVGLFSGGDPVVWFSNAYSPVASIASGSVTNYGDFSSIPQALLDQVNANAGPFSYDHISPDFAIPSLWKASLRAERVFDFSNIWEPLGDDWLFGVQLAYSKVRDGAAFRNRAQLANTIQDVNVANLVAANTGVAPDGRPIYPIVANEGIGIGDAIQLINTNEGESLAASIAVEKAFDFGLTLYGSYTYTDSDRLIPGSSSRHISNYRSLVTADRNSAGPAGTSVFEVEDRFVLTAKYERDFFGDLESQFVLKGIVESGPVSNAGYINFLDEPDTWIFGAAAGGDPFGGVDLLYIPMLNASGTGFSDPNVVFSSPSNEARFLEEITELGLLGDAGGLVDKNGLRGPWNQRWDLGFTQELPGIPGAEQWVGENRLLLDIDIFNVANLLNSDWGGQIGDARFDALSVVEAYLVEASVADDFRNGVIDSSELRNNYIATNHGSVCQVQSDCTYVYDTVFGNDKFEPRLSQSVWQVRVGLRYRF